MLLPPGRLRPGLPSSVLSRLSWQHRPAQLVTCLVRSVPSICMQPGALRPKGLQKHTPFLGLGHREGTEVTLGSAPRESRARPPRPLPCISPNSKSIVQLFRKKTCLRPLA